MSHAECAIALLSEFGRVKIPQKTEKGDEQIMASLDNVSTKDLVEELRRREGVEATIAEPYEDVEIKVNGPAIVLVVTD